MLPWARLRAWTPRHPTVHVVRRSTKLLTLTLSLVDFLDSSSRARPYRSQRVDNIGIALTAGGSQISPGSIIASSLAPNASTVVTATPGLLAQDVTLQYTNGNSTPTGALGIEFFAGADGFLNPDTVYPVDNVEFNNLSLTASPVPEPSMLTLLGAGLAFIAVIRRRVAFS